MNMLEQQIEYTDHAIALLESIKLKSKTEASGAAENEDVPTDWKMTSWRPAAGLRIASCENRTLGGEDASWIILL